MKCDYPVKLEGGLQLGCTRDEGHPADDRPQPGGHEYDPSAKRFDGQVILCAVCSSQVGDTTSDGTSPTDCPQCATRQALARDLEVDDATFDSEEAFNGAIIMCPIDQTSIDAERWGVQTHTCPDCAQVFTVELLPDAVRQFSMY
jgi:uncharacterized CHY-type Zn-finger protein